MALVINTNLNSIKAQINLDRTQSSLSTSLQRISSGLRINSPRDDAAGLAISQRLTSQIGKLGQAVKNANDGISLAQSATGALQEISTALQKIQELATQANNGSISPTDRNLLQTQVVKLNEGIGQIAEDAEFNGQKVLTGNIVNAEFQVGLGAEQSVRVTIPLTAAASIGNYSIRTDNARARAIGAASPGTEQGVAPKNLVLDQTLTIRGSSSDRSGTVVGVELEETAKSIAQKINAVEGLTGVTAVANTFATLGGDTLEEGIYDIAASKEQNISFNLYGTNVRGDDSSNAVFISARITSNTKEGLLDLVTAINNKTTSTGIRASFITEINDEGREITKIALENGGADIGIEKFRNDPVGESTGVDATALKVKGLPGTQDVTLTEDTDTDSVTVGGTVTLNSAKAFTATSGADEESSLFSRGFLDIAQTADFAALSFVNVSTEEGAKKAIVTAASALDFVSSLLGDLGAIQNRFESTISNLGSVQENTQTARSRILDADFAQETANLTRAQVLQQAGIAILAQANTTPQAVLALLRT